MTGSDGRGGPQDLIHDLLEFAQRELDGPVAGLGAMSADISQLAGEGSANPYSTDLDKIEGAAAQLRVMTERLLDPAGALESRASSIREIRHDLRTPLTAILGYGELVAEEADEAGDAALVSALAALVEAAHRLLAAVDRLSGLALREESVDNAKAGLPALSEIVGGRAQPDGAAGEHEEATRIVGRILVVDDTASMRDLISRRIGRHGHSVSCCDSGEEALALTEEGGFDLVMLDLLMPGMNGLEVLTRLKRHPASQAIPVLVMSALDDIEAAVRCIEAGADDYLQKPLDETLLRARIGSSLERKFLRDRERETVAELQSEKRRSDALLHNILPVSVVKRLRAGETLIADHFDAVTVLFCDLAGFTALSARLGPAATLELLGEIFAGFDALADEYDVEKIKTIGDAYMVVGGMTDAADDSAGRVAAMACRMPAVVRSARGTDELGIRIGIDTGPAAGGIIGTKRFFYDVWGDTVNTASRLEAACEPGRILVSAATRHAVGTACRFAPRKPVDLHGKGRMQTFYLDY